MIKTVWNFFNFGFLKKLDKYLLLNRPWLWNLKLHYIAFYSLFFSLLIAIIVLSSSISYTGFGLIYPILIISLLVIEGVIFLYWIYRQSFLFYIEKGYGDIKKIGGSKEVFLWIVITFLILLPSITLFSTFKYKLNHFNVDPSNTKFEMLLPRYFLLDTCLGDYERETKLRREEYGCQKKELKLLKEKTNLNTLESEYNMILRYEKAFFNSLTKQEKIENEYATDYIPLSIIQNYFTRYDRDYISVNILLIISILFLILYYAFLYKHNIIYNFLGSIGGSVFLTSLYFLLLAIINIFLENRGFKEMIYEALGLLGFSILLKIFFMIIMKKYSRLNIMIINIFLLLLFTFSGLCVIYILQDFNFCKTLTSDSNLYFLFSFAVSLWYIFIFILFAGFVKRKLLKLYALPRD